MQAVIFYHLISMELQEAVILLNKLQRKNMLQRPRSVAGRNGSWYSSKCDNNYRGPQPVPYETQESRSRSSSSPLEAHDHASSQALAHARRLAMTTAEGAPRSGQGARYGCASRGIVTRKAQRLQFSVLFGTEMRSAEHAHI
jgi:hypothetical protein